MNIRNKTKQVTGYKVGIVGSEGFLGQSFAYALNTKNYIFMNDVSVDPDSITHFSKEQIVEMCDMAIVSVPTPYSTSKGYIPDIIDNVLIELNSHALDRNKVFPVCIKSAILPEHVTRLIEENKNLSIVISPEYLSGRDPIREMINCDVLIMGGEDKTCDLFIDLFKNHSIITKDLKIGKCSAQEAALIKYMENCFLGLKVFFASEFYEYYQKMAGNVSGYNEILRQWMFDSRMGEYPLKIPYENSLGYCSGCIEKDVPAIIDSAGKLDIDLGLMKYVSAYNEIKFRKGYHPYCESRPNEVWRD